LSPQFGLSRTEGLKNIYNMIKLLKPVALFGNGLYILWILFNAMDERSQGTRPLEAAVLLGLIVLLTINIIVIYKKS
jgi:hypothetical protein